MCKLQVLLRTRHIIFNIRLCYFQALLAYSLATVSHYWHFPHWTVLKVTQLQSKDLTIHIEYCSIYTFWITNRGKEKAVVQIFSGYNNGKKHLTILIQSIVKTMKKLLLSCTLHHIATMIKMDFASINRVVFYHECSSWMRQILMKIFTLISAIVEKGKSSFWHQYVCKSFTISQLEKQLRENYLATKCKVVLSVTLGETSVKSVSFL